MAAQSRDFELKLLAIDKNESDPALREKKILAMADGNANLQKRIKDQLPAVTSPWYRYFISYDPRPALAKVKCPVLALNGAKDQQVDAAQNVPAIQDALKEAGNLDATVQIVPGVNHLFQNAASGAVAEYGSIEETISPQVLDTIAAWIQRHTAN